MQMVAASKMRKAQEAAIAARRSPGCCTASSATRPRRPIEFKHPLLETREVRKRAVILVAADKGLCGALNTNVFRLATQFDPAVDPVHHRRTQGRAVRRVARGGSSPPSSPTATRPRFAEARAIAAFARDLFLNGEVDQVHIVATQFHQHADPGAGVARVPSRRRDHGAAPSGRRSRRGARRRYVEDALFEPSAEDVLGYLLPHYLNIFFCTWCC